MSETADVPENSSIPLSNNTNHDDSNTNLSDVCYILL